MLINKKYMWLSIVIAMALCIAQIMGNAVLIIAGLGAFMVLLGIACANDFTLPLLLFFLPWSPIMRLNPTSFSVYTFGLVLVCLISVIKKKFRFRVYHIAAGVILLFLTLLSKLIDGNGLSFSYIAFMMLIVLFPVVKEESNAQKYDFYQVVSFFSLGIIIAALCALNFANYPGIRQYIRVDMYHTVTRRSGFYGDPNFYTAQVTAALGGALSLILGQRKKGQIAWLGLTAFLLLYCGFLSGSKSFALVTACLLVLWITAFLKVRGRTGLKVVLLISVILVAVYVATSVMFRGLLDVLITRFASTKDLDSFTTGRLELWDSYLREIFGSFKQFFLGSGFTNTKVNGRASHNTIIQCVYQFGVLGTPILWYWIVFFSKDRFRKRRMRDWLSLKSLIVFIGAFLPWLAIDMLFFDEFFLFQWYMLVALQQESVTNNEHNRIIQERIDRSNLLNT